MNNLSLTLRPETEQDVAFLKRLFRSTREDLLQLGLPEPMLENLMLMQFNAQQSSYHSQFPNAEFSIVEKNGEPIACLVIHRDDAAISIVNIALLAEERGKGYGSSLITTLQDEAATANKPVTLSVSCMNLRAQQLYQSLGFRVIDDTGANLEMIWHQDV
ncbi:MAG: GNAT family N-acetyltransferase [Gallionellaceae bacterium]